MPAEKNATEGTARSPTVGSTKPTSQAEAQSVRTSLTGAAPSVGGVEKPRSLLAYAAHASKSLAAPQYRSPREVAPAGGGCGSATQACHHAGIAPAIPATRRPASATEKSGQERGMPPATRSEAWDAPRKPSPDPRQAAPPLVVRSPVPGTALAKGCSQPGRSSHKRKRPRDVNISAKLICIA